MCGSRSLFRHCQSSTVVDAEDTFTWCCHDSDKLDRAEWREIGGKNKIYIYICASTVNRTRGLEIFSLALSQLSYRSYANINLLCSNNLSSPVGCVQPTPPSSTALLLHLLCITYALSISNRLRTLGLNLKMPPPIPHQIASTTTTWKTVSSCCTPHSLSLTPLPQTPVPLTY